MRLSLVLALSACGRLSFDATTGDGGSDGATDGGIQLAENQVALGAGGNARRVLVPGADLSRLYVLYGRSRLFYSVDAGETFHDCAPIQSYVTAFDANTAGRVVVATARGVYESTDGCATFTPIGLQNGWVNTVRLDGSVLYAGPNAGLHRYDAPSWTPIPSPADGSFAYDILPGPVKLLGGPEPVGMLRSTDGVTWTPSGTGIPGNTAILDIVRAGTEIWAATSAGLYVSTDDGMSWTERHSGWSDVIAVDPGDPSSLAHWSSAFTISTNGGATWTDLDPPEMARARVIDVAFDPAGSGAAFIASARGLFRIDKDRTVRALGKNIDGWSVNRSIATGTTRLLATTAGVFRIPADGVPALIDTGAVVYSQINDLAVFGSSVFAAGRSIGKSNDGGQTYASVYTGDLTDGYQITALAMTPDALFGVTNGRILRSPDGSAWSGPLVAVGIGNALAAVPGTPNEVIAGCDQAGIFASLDDGATFNQVSTTRSIYGLQPMPDGSVLVATGNGVHRAATPAGPYAPYSLAGNVVTAIALRGTSTVFIGVIDGIMKSTDGGMTFQPITGFGGRAPVALEIDAATGDLLVGTNGWGFYRIPSP